MGTWDTGHFDNDTAADFADELDAAPTGRRAAMVHEALRRALAVGDVGDGLGQYDGLRAVAAAALVAAQCPGGEPVAAGYGPRQPVPLPAAEWRPLAASVVVRALGPESELTEGWCEYRTYLAWRSGLERLLTVLRLPEVPSQEGLF